MALEVQRNFHIRGDTQAVQLRIQQLEQSTQRLSEELQVAADTRFREGLARQMGYVHKEEVLAPKPAQPPSRPAAAAPVRPAAPPPAQR